MGFSLANMSLYSLSLILLLFSSYYTAKIEPGVDQESTDTSDASEEPTYPTETTEEPDSTIPNSTPSPADCPVGWVDSFEGCFLFHYTKAVTWHDAQLECEAMGGYLAEPKREDQALLLI